MGHSGVQFFCRSLTHDDNLNRDGFSGRDFEVYADSKSNFSSAR